MKFVRKPGKAPGFFSFRLVFCRCLAPNYAVHFFSPVIVLSNVTATNQHRCAYARASDEEH